MAAQDIVDALKAEVARVKEVDDSAVALINGINARVDAAVTAALENGATAEQLAPITDLTAALKADSDALGAAVSANTPAATP